jgi:hypothetical protein
MFGHRVRRRKRRLNLMAKLERIVETKRASLPLLFEQLPECEPPPARPAAVAAGSAA